MTTNQKIYAQNNAKAKNQPLRPKPQKSKIKFGTMAGKLHYKDSDFVGLDPDIQEMFYKKL